MFGSYEISPPPALPRSPPATLYRFDLFDSVAAPITLYAYLRLCIVSSYLTSQQYYSKRTQHNPDTLHITYAPFMSAYESEAWLTASFIWVCGCLVLTEPPPSPAPPAAHFLRLRFVWLCNSTHYIVCVFVFMYSLQLSYTSQEYYSERTQHDSLHTVPGRPPPLTLQTETSTHTSL